METNVRIGLHSNSERRLILLTSRRHISSTSLLANMRRAALQMASVLAICLSLPLSGCTNTRAPGLAERDQYVVNTPARYSENRVFYFGPLKEKSEPTELVSTTDLTRELISNSDSGRNVLSQKMAHGEPLNIIVTNAKLPPISIEDSSCRFMSYWCYAPKTRDIALILDVDAQVDAPSKQIVVWYQRSVPAEQSLNFGNLQVYHADAWDSRLAPVLRLRLIDVTAEKNIETREALADVAKFGSSILSATTGPTGAMALNAGTKAAALILAGTDNKMLLDYTVQFFGAGRVQKGGGAIQTPLLSGRFILFGKENVAGSTEAAFWSRPYAYDEAEQRICVLGTAGKCTDSLVTSPTITIAVDSAETIINSIVQKRSDYLTLLLSQASTSSLDGIVGQADQLSGSIKMYVAKEKLFRYRQVEDLSGIVQLVISTDDSEIKNVGMKLIRQTTGCSALEATNLGDWWTAHGANITSNADSEMPSFQADCL